MDSILSIYFEEAIVYSNLDLYKLVIFSIPESSMEASLILPLSRSGPERMSSILPPF
jgi:hypothetical protein